MIDLLVGEQGTLVVGNRFETRQMFREQVAVSDQLLADGQIPSLVVGKSVIAFGDRRPRILGSRPFFGGGWKRNAASVQIQ
jgi:hypothetical protein